MASDGSPGAWLSVGASVVLLLLCAGCGDADEERAARHDRVNGEHLAFLRSIWTLDTFLSSLADKHVPDLPGWKEEVGLHRAKQHGLPPEVRDAVVAEWRHLRALLAEPAQGARHPRMSEAGLDRAEANLKAMSQHVTRIRAVLEPYRERIRAEAGTLSREGKPADPGFADRLFGE